MNIFELVKLKEDAEKWRNLRNLCGFLGNGSQTTVTLYQDDATETVHLKVGQRSYFESSFERCIEQAMKDYKED